MTTVALIPYRPQLPAAALDQVQRLGAAILCTFDRVGVCDGKEGVSFTRIRLHRGEFVSYALGAQSLSAEDQALIMQELMRERLQHFIRQPLALTRDADQILIVIDLRRHPKNWRARARHWWYMRRTQHE